MLKENKDFDISEAGTKKKKCLWIKFLLLKLLSWNKDDVWLC